ncbi:MAG TPA: TIGR04283 family arsenosugar biosynthesis glycosyltransferase [Pyrinomonadaceae bacterium]|jgi:rSAM/selenodomain-associated transferase 2
MSTSHTPTLSIIIPALNEARCIGATLDAISQLSVRVEMIVVDGGSNDDTREISSAHGAKVIASERGRGVQMHKGARSAQADVLWFLHADTIVPADAVEFIDEAFHNPRVIAGNFDVRFNGRGSAARFMTWLYPQLRRLGLCYGDSAIFVRREAYEQVGGFKSFPIFEDLDLLRELRKLGGIVHVPATVVTSSRRFEGRRFAFMFAKWMVMQALFWLGIQPRTLGRFYAPVRSTPARHESAE